MGDRRHTARPIAIRLAGQRARSQRRACHQGSPVIKTALVRPDGRECFQQANGARWPCGGLGQLARPEGNSRSVVQENALRPGSAKAKTVPAGKIPQGAKPIAAETENLEILRAGQPGCRLQPTLRNRLTAGRTGQRTVTKESAFQGRSLSTGITGGQTVI